MKIALLYSGEPRLFRDGWNISEETVRRDRDIDVFLHAWFSPELVGSSYRSLWNDESGGLIDSDIPSALVSVMKPKRWLIEPYRKWPSKERMSCSMRDSSIESIKAFQSYSYSNHIVSLLKRQYEQEHGFIYDVVVHLRYDSAIQSRLEIETLDYSSPHTLYVAHHVTDTQLNDQVYLGNSKVMDTYTDCFLHLDEIYDHPLRGEGNFCSHNLLRIWCTLNSILPIKLPTFNFGLLRFNGDSSYVWSQSG